MTFLDQTNERPFHGRYCTVRDYWHDITGRGRMLLHYPATLTQPEAIRVHGRAGLEPATIGAGGEPRTKPLQRGELAATIPA